jgi:cytochrome bd-type quinol oxidase subunit 1
VPTTDVAVTFGGFVLLYTVLGVIDLALMYLSARRGLGTGADEGPPGQARESAGELVY